MNVRQLTKHLTLASLILAASSVEAGLFKNSVDLADLAEVSAESLEVLRDSEFEAFVAQIGLTAARASERIAEGAEKAAARILETENLDLKAAKAELQAAKSNKDTERMATGATVLSRAETDQRRAKLFREWKDADTAAKRAAVKAAASRLDLAEANRDLERARLLVREKATSGFKYDLADLGKSVSKRQKEFDEANRKAQFQASKAAAFEFEWQRLPANVPEPD